MKNKKVTDKQIIDAYGNSYQLMQKAKQNETRKRYWVCIIGDTEHSELPFGSDSPMRQAVQNQFKKITGHDADDTWSGWSANKKAVDQILKAWSNEK